MGAFSTLPTTPTQRYKGNAYLYSFDLYLKYLNMHAGSISL